MTMHQRLDPDSERYDSQALCSKHTVQFRMRMTHEVFCSSRVQKEPYLFFLCKNWA